MTMRVPLVVGAVFAGGLAPAMCLAESATGAKEQAISAAIRAQEDPTILKRRIWLDTELSEFKDGSKDVLATAGLFWVWGVSDMQDWGVRLKLPLKFHTAGDAAGDSDREGLENIKLLTGTAYRLSESWRAGGGVELRFPSATNHLGDDVWRLQLLGAVAWDVTQQVTLSPSFELNKSIAEEHGSAPQHFLELYFPATFALPERWYVTPQAEAKVDFANHDHLTRTIKVSVGKQLGQLPLGLSLSLKKPFDGSNKRFQMNFVATYYFQ